MTQHFHTACVAVTLILWTFANALAAGTDQQQRETAFLKKQYSGWGGLIVRCTQSPLSDKLMAEICDALVQDARFLSAAAKITFRQPSPPTSLETALSRIDIDGLVMTIGVVGTGPGTGVRGVYVGVQVGNFYSDVVDPKSKPGSAETKPRSGTLVLWEKNLIGTGADEIELKNAIVQSTHTLLQSFFSEFLESR